MKVKRNIDVHAKAIIMLVFVGLLWGHTLAALLGTYGRTNPTTNAVPNNFKLLGASGSGGVDTDGRYSSGRTKLKRLDLFSTEITDAGLEHLKGLTKLKELNLAGSQHGGAR